MSSGRNNEADTVRYQASPDTVYDSIDDRSVLINTRTNEIYELNRTGARFWELLLAGHDLAEIRRLMLREFDVGQAELDRETDELLATLETEGLIHRVR